MSENPAKNKSGAGKFILGAAIGAAIGAIAGRFFKIDEDEEEFVPAEPVEKKPKPKKRSTK